VSGIHSDRGEQAFRAISPIPLPAYALRVTVGTTPLRASDFDDSFGVQYCSAQRNRYSDICCGYNHKYQRFCEETSVDDCTAALGLRIGRSGTVRCMYHLNWTALNGSGLSKIMTGHNTLFNGNCPAALLLSALAI